MDQDAELKAAREKLAARFADAAQIGGKGKRSSHYDPLRSSVLHLPSHSLIGVQPLSDIDEVNMFKDDNTVVHFKRPHGKSSRAKPV
jgi:hypothetical protein